MVSVTKKTWGIPWYLHSFGHKAATISLRRWNSSLKRRRLKTSSALFQGTVEYTVLTANEVYEEGSSSSDESDESNDRSEYIIPGAFDLIISTTALIYPSHSKSFPSKLVVLLHESSYW